MKRIGILFLAVAMGYLAGLSGSAWALRSFVLSQDSALYGQVHQVKVGDKETLLDIAREFGLGYNQIVAANPGIDPWVPPKGGLVNVPRALLLPRDRLSSGVVVNLAEMRLYYFFSDGGHDYFLTAPTGIGAEGFLTELGVYTVKSKTPNPTWVVPESIRQEDPSLPASVPPGPDNPLGDYAFRLSHRAYAIHGTNKPWGIGRRVSHGCIRLYPEDVGALYPIVPVGAKVQVIYEPVKYGWAEGLFWVQAFEDFEKRSSDPLMTIMEELLFHQATMGPLDIDRETLEKVLRERTGVPVVVARPREK
jgi:L,D-transpeptidase ErfK/SrfK